MIKFIWHFRCLPIISYGNRMFCITWLLQFLLLFSSVLLRIFHLFSLWLDNIGLKAVALHSFKSQSLIPLCSSVFQIWAGSSSVRNQCSNTRVTFDRFNWFFNFGDILAWEIMIIQFIFGSFSYNFGPYMVGSYWKFHTY